jgi:DNA polymerase-3 subunit epsilon
MRLLGLDLETTGLDWKTERVLEVGVSLHEAGDPVYLHQNTWTFNDEELQKRLPLPDEIKRLTGIRDEVISEFGIHPTTAYRELDAYVVERRVSFIVAHNGSNFDRPFLLHELDKFGIEAPALRTLPWLDTRRDIKYKPGEEPKQKSLAHLLMLKRFIPAIAHRALADAANTMWLLSHYDIDEIIEYAKIPWITVSVGVHYDERELAKAQGYSWQEINHKVYPKSWVKLIKGNELEAEEKKFPRHAVRIVG